MSDRKLHDGEGEGEDDQRATVVPSFDVGQLARDSRRLDAPARSESGVRVAPDAVPKEEGSVYARAAEVYWERLGGAAAVPVLHVPLRDVEPRHRARCEGFLLCRIDGRSTLREIIDASGLPELTALSLACDLQEAGVITLRPGAAAETPTLARGAPSGLRA